MSEYCEQNELKSAPKQGRADLQADCANCFALCCVAPAFSASADFAIHKHAGQPCPNLRTDFRCGIHTHLRQQGFRGCTVYDCFGAGQKVSRVIFGGQDWRRNPRTAQQMFEVFSIVRDLHELLWYLTEAQAMPTSRPLYDEISRALAETERLTHNSPAALLELDTATHRQNNNALLLRASELARVGVRNKKQDYRGADLVGARLRGASLRGASLRGACLIGADLRGADLSLADLTGADFRDADIRGADLAKSLFVIQSQLDAAQGDASTKVPPALTRPAHW